MKMSFKLDIIIFCFVLLFIFSAFILLRAESIVSMGELQLNRALDVVSQFEVYQVAQALNGTQI